ncbi:unnamed protein product [Arabis nemorensis]|uniref:Uncharacterized protein n=1 Tax=Arabis nemorensis TaxID=586526 RepID=A0A565CI43_9BRAS|nr:unnamed protein product [Arabis nemorensis]
MGKRNQFTYPDPAQSNEAYYGPNYPYDVPPAAAQPVQQPLDALAQQAYYEPY